MVSVEKVHVSHVTTFEHETTSKWDVIKGDIIPILEKKVQRRKQLEVEVKRRCISVVIYVIFLTLFTYVCLYGRDVGETHYYRQAVRAVLLDDDFDSSHTTFEDIFKKSHITSYLKSCLMPQLFDRKDLFGSDNTELYTDLRLRVVRIQPKTESIFGGGSSSTLGVYSSNVVVTSDMENVPEEDGAFPTWGRYTQSAGNAAPVVSGVFQNYASGGYVLTLSKSFNSTQAIARLDEVAGVGYLSSNDTRAIFADFTVYFGDVNMFAVVTLLWEITPAGHVIPSCTLRIVNFYRQGRTVTFINFWLEVAMFGMVVVLFLRDMYLWKQIGRSYIKRGWFKVSLLNYIIFVVVAVIELYFVSTKNSLTRDTSSFQSLAFLSMMVQYVNSFNAVLSWVRVVPHLELVSTKSKSVVATIAASIPDLGPLLMILFLVFLGFGLAFHMAFGEHVHDFRSLPESLFSLFRAIMGDFDTSGLNQSNRILGPGLFIIFMIVVYLIMLNMFMALVLKSYDTVLSELTEENETEAKVMQRILTSLWKKRSLSKVHAFREKAVSDDTLTYSELAFLYEKDHEVFKQIGIDSVRQLIDLADVDNDGCVSLQEVRKLQNTKQVEAASGAASRATSVTPTPALSELVAGGARPPSAKRGLFGRGIDETELERALAAQNNALKHWIRTELSHFAGQISGFVVPQKVPPPPPRKTEE